MRLLRSTPPAPSIEGELVTTANERKIMSMANEGKIMSTANEGERWNVALIGILRGENWTL